MENFRQLVEQEFIAQAKYLKDLRQLVSDCLEQEGCDQEFIQRMVLAVNEGCMNIIQHGYSDCDDAKFTIEIYSNAQELMFLLTDNAPTIEKKNIRSRDLDDIRPGGLGVYFIHEIMDQVEYLENPKGTGNVLQMKKRLELH